jgi:hypothetical protein
MLLIGAKTGMNKSHNRYQKTPTTEVGKGRLRDEGTAMRAE